jgi:hypothetical protein
MAEDWDDTPGEDDLMIHAVTVDDYGVPSNLMGTHHEDFFALLGRVVALSASLENHVLVIYQSLVGAAQNHHTNVPVGNLLARCRKELHRLEGRPNDRQLVEIFLSKAETTIERRNHYVHNLWPAQPGGRLFGWRPPREKGAQEAITVEATLPEMRRDLASLVELLDVRRWHRLLSVVSSIER